MLKNVRRLALFVSLIALSAIKSACGGESEADLSRIETLMDAFPKDAERADLQRYVDFMRRMPKAKSSLTSLLGKEIAPEKIVRLCAAALPLSVEWLTLEAFSSNDESMPKDQEIFWEALCETAEML